jgi:hypothetical protein
MTGAGAYVDSLQRSWIQRADEGSSGTAHVDIAGWHVRIDATPSHLADQLGGAFDPMRRPHRTPDLQVRVAAGGRPPVPRGHDWSERDGLYFHDGRFEIHADPGAPLSVVDHATATAVCWFPDADLPFWERGAPLRTLLSWFGLRHGTLLLHGAAVAEGGRAVLLVGPGGAGKTTTSLAAWTHGMDYLGDDYVLVRAGSPVTVARAYATAKADARTLELLPTLADQGATAVTGLDDPTASEDKRVMHLVGARGLDTVEAPVAAVVLLRVATEADLRSASPGEVLRAATPSAMFQLQCDRRAAFPLLADVVRRSPCYVLDTGPDPRQAAELLRELLRVGNRDAP